MPRMRCPCESGSDYTECCHPYHTGRFYASRAVELMRSRYSAYALGEIRYLVETTHPSARCTGLEATYRTSAESIQWIGLEVLSTSQGGERDKTGKVEFKADYIQGGAHSIHHERSRFKRHAGRWHYVDGQVDDQVVG